MPIPIAIPISMNRAGFYGGNAILDFVVCSFSSAWKKTNQKKTPVSRLFLRVAKPVEEATSHAAMQCCSARSGAHNLAIAARLTSHCALPDSMMLASSSGFSV